MSMMHLYSIPPIFFINHDHADAMPSFSIHSPIRLQGQINEIKTQRNATLQITLLQCSAQCSGIILPQLYCP